MPYNSALSRSSTRLAALLIPLIVSLPLRAEQTIESGPEKVPLLELYTSEGCSSCPPADRWLSSLEPGDGLWTDYVPVAFHVDYWNYIGWEDRFASAEFSDRQRRYAREGAVDVVYTPGVMLDGKEWRQWRRGTAPLIGDKAAGRLSAVVDDDVVRVAFDPDDRLPANLVAHVAWLGSGLVTDVGAGENRGRELHHDFVVLAFSSARLDTRDGAYLAVLPRPDELVASPRYALAAWVTSDKTLAPLQSAGGWLNFGD